MAISIRAAVCVAALSCNGCFTVTLAEKYGASGWFRADGPAPAERVPLVTAASSCDEVIGRQGDPARPIIVLIPGINGDDAEAEGAVRELVDSAPASIYMFRWVPYERRDAITARLAEGISRLAECLPDSRGRIVVIAHSAGGVLASFAAGQIKVPPSDKAWVTILTVAAPLAGTLPRPGLPAGREDAAFFLDLGTRIMGYPRAAPGVRVLHLRTEYPADNLMRPWEGLQPNDPAIGVPGAWQVELPAGLSHAAALEYVARAVARGRAEQWF